jgi:hypothetical protein
MRRVNSITLLLLVAGCTYNPVIDPKTSRHPENYQSDLAECRQISEQAPGGGARSSRGKAQIVRNCLKARGYSVLN